MPSPASGGSPLLQFMGDHAQSLGLPQTRLPFPPRCFWQLKGALLPKVNPKASSSPLC